MITEQQVKIMKSAYGTLYELENTMRTYIQIQMEKNYGIHWYHLAPRQVLKRPPLKKRLEQFQFHEYEPYFRNYSSVFKNLPQKFFTHLHLLYPLRNKIAHNQVLSQSELQVFEKSTSIVLAYMSVNHYEKTS